MSGSREKPAVRLEPWGPDDLDLLTRLLGDPAMTEHLGGPESPEKLANRQRKYETLTDTSDDRMFKIVLVDTGEEVGSVGYWKQEWNGEEVYETGWSVLPAFQRRGIAEAATRLVVEEARGAGLHRYMLAYPAVDNAASNAICRKLGFILLGAGDFEYPKGHFMRCNEWRLDLRPK